MVGLVCTYLLPGDAVVPFCDAFPPLHSLLSSCRLSRFQTAALLSISSHWLGFAFSLLLRTNKWFDVTEDIAYLCIFIWAYGSVETPSPRQQLVAGLATIWISRLLGFLLTYLPTYLLTYLLTYFRWQAWPQSGSPGCSAS